MDHSKLAGNIARFRKAKNLTQEQVAEYCSVSPQAVSKWETGAASPDIQMLPVLAELFAVSIDSLFGNQVNTVFVPEEQRKSPDELLFKIRVLGRKGEIVKVNLPLVFIKMFVQSGAELHLGQNNSDFMKNIDFDLIFALIDKGVVGKLVEVSTPEGDIVEIFVE